MGCIKNVYHVANTMFINCTNDTMINVSYPDICKQSNLVNEDILLHIGEMFVITLMVVTPCLLCIMGLKCYERYTMYRERVRDNLGVDELGMRRYFIEKGVGVTQPICVS